MKMSPDTSYQS